MGASHEAVGGVALVGCCILVPSPRRAQDRVLFADGCTRLVVIDLQNDKGNRVTSWSAILVG